jgi:fumarylacetoacetate (FAA) hydrolase
MKLASLKNGRDGLLIVADAALAMAVDVGGIVPTLQEALENWDAVAPELDQVYGMLCAGQARDAFALDVRLLAAPLPRAYQWLDASAYLSHVALVRQSRGMEMPKDAATNPLMYQGVSDNLLGAHDDIRVADVAFGIDFEAEVAVIVDDVPMGVTPVVAAGHIKLVMLVNDVSLRVLAQAEVMKGLGFIQAKPASAFSPVAVTPDTLGKAWQGGKLHLPLLSHYNGEAFGHPNAGMDMAFDFSQLVAHAARTRDLSAGTIIGSGTVSNHDAGVGSSCIVEKRMRQGLLGQEVMPFMQFGDTVRIEMLDANGQSLFGAIQQTVRQA